MIKACIFDFDGVICNTEQFALEFKYEKLNEWGFSITKEELKKIVGTNFTQAFPLLFPNVQEPQIYIDRYYSERSQMEVPYDEIFNREIFELLDYCKENNIICAIASNSTQKRVIREAKNLHIDTYMSGLFGYDNAGCMKPDPRFYEYALKELDVLPHEAIIIEDSKLGIQAAVGANVFTIAKKDFDFGTDQSKANTSVETLDQVIDIIKNLNQ